VLSQKELKEKLKYNKTTGDFIWLQRPSNRVHVGDVAGCQEKKHGYILIRINKVLYKAHQLAWLYVTGRWPKNELDHKNKNTSNNKWSNLRKAKRIEQMGNTKLYRSNTSGSRGIRKTRNNTWSARIVKRGKEIHLGTFKTKKKAKLAYCSAAKAYFGKFYNE